MARRKVALVEGEIYHLFNRSINKEIIFGNEKICYRAHLIFNYYQFKSSVRFSYFINWPKERRQEFLNLQNRKDKKLVEIIAFCLMPNHFHFILKQLAITGISQFLGLFQNSFAKYFNTRFKRRGHLLEGEFKAVRVETQEQLLHLSRYLHLNPYSGSVVKTIKDLMVYPWSSFPDYLGKRKGSVSKELILSQFPNIQAYKNFVLDRADYQKKLEQIKNLLID